MSTSHQQGGSRQSIANSGFEDIADQSAKLVEDARELGSRAMGTAGEAVHELRKQGGKKAAQFKDGFDDLVSEHPAKSVLIALGVGALLGVILARRN